MLESFTDHRYVSMNTYMTTKLSYKFTNSMFTLPNIILSDVSEISKITDEIFHNIAIQMANALTALHRCV